MPRKKTKAKKPPIPRVIAERLARTRRRMADANLPAYLVTNPPDQYYLTGFTGEDGAALITPRQVYLLTDGRFTEQARVEAGWANARIRIKGLSDELTKLARRLGFDRLGIQPNHLTLRMADTIRKAIRPARLVKAKPIADNLRLRKDPAEIQAIRRAARVAQDAFHATRRAIRIGMTEREIAARLEYEMQRRGAAGPAFPTIVAEGPSAALPHYRPAARRIRPGSLILIDWGATVDHYRSDLTRVLFVRTISPRFRRIYRAVAEAQRRAIQAVRPGASTRDVDGAARRYLRSAGLGKAFSHSTGHGLGLDIHEPPGVGPLRPRKLEPGMVVTIEPGVYLPGLGGVRIEDDVRVTDEGVERLTSLSTELDDMVIRG